MKTTKSGKQILPLTATYRKQLDEIRDAVSKANEQIRQVPTYWCFRYLCLLLCLFFFSTLFVAIGFVIWEQSIDSCVCTKNICQLQKTGADL